MSFDVIHYCQPPGMEVLSRDITANFALQYGALKIEKLKARHSPALSLQGIPMTCALCTK